MAKLTMDDVAKRLEEIRTRRTSQPNTIATLLKSSRNKSQATRLRRPR